MDIRIEQIEENLIVFPAGRLDGYGSGQLQKIITTHMNDTVKFVIFDLTDVPYVSSAGIRVLLVARKMVTHNEGAVILCNISSFVSNVLKMAGMEKIFQIEPDLNHVLSKINGNNRNGITPIHYDLDKGIIEISPIGTDKSVLHVTGSLTRVLHAQISPEHMFQIRFSDCEYSIGLGALAENPDQARHLLGEMVTLQGSIVWLPTDGNEVPDFFIPVQDTGTVRIFTGFNAALQGPFHDMVTFSPHDPEGMSISRLYQSIFEYARKNHPEYSGIVAVALIGESGGIRSSGIRHSPIPEYAPAGGGTIMDPDNFREWIEVSDVYQYTGEIIVAFGIGIDLTHDLSSFTSSELSALSYIHPANRGMQEISLHTHGVVFKNASLQPTSDIGEKIKNILNIGEFLDMRHLMDDTRLRSAQLAVAYISKIEIDETG